MMYEDKDGRIMMPEEIEDLSLWEIEDMGIHVSECQERLGLSPTRA